MTVFLAKTYQQQVLDSVEAYFRACHELPSPSLAFSATVNIRHRAFDSERTGCGNGP